MSPEKITLNELILCTLNACLHQDPNRIGAGEGSPIENYFLHFLLFNLLPPPYWPMRAPHSSWRNSSKPSTETFSPFSSQTYQVPTVGPSLLSQWRHVQLLLKDIVLQTLSFLTFSRNLLLSCILQIKLISLLCLNASVNSLPLRRTSKSSLGLAGQWGRGSHWDHLQLRHTDCSILQRPRSLCFLA